MSALAINQAIALAIQHHQAGRLAEAESIYRQILATNPNHPDALHLLGLIAHQTGHNDFALQLIQRSLAINPYSADPYGNLGKILTEQGNFDQAIAAYGTAIRMKPDFAMAHYNLSVAYQKKGDSGRAMASCREAIRLQPDLAEAHCNLGNALADLGQREEAIASFRQAIHIKPDYAQAYSNLGNVLTLQNELDQAITAIESAIAIDPKSAESHFNLGNVFHEQQRFDKAIAAYQAAIRINPKVTAFHLNLGGSLRRLGRPDDAITAYRAALAIDPNTIQAHSKIGRAHEERGDLDCAIAEYRTAIDIRPDHGDSHLHLAHALALKGDVEACSRELNLAIAAYRADVNANPNCAESHFKLSIALLLNGEFMPGWREYEWRSRVKEYRSNEQDIPQPRWTGDDLGSRTILLHTEQGFGDTFQFIRYLPMVAQRGGKVVTWCPPSLVRLLQVSFPGYKFITTGDPPVAFDTHFSLGSLPLACGTSLQSIPNQVPYIHAELTASRRWQKRLEQYSRSLKVGLCWAGNKGFKYDFHRSPRRLELFAPLAELKNVCFFSLQKGDAAAQAAHPPPGLHLIDWSADLHDFADTAALIANLDLVITSDTAVAHLAGAMGKPVWLLLHTVPDWRWMLMRSDNPWYPTMRIFRQTKIDQWSDVIEQVTEALKATAPGPDNAHRVEL